MSKRIETPVSILISDLESIYKEIEVEANRVQFFIKIAHYGDYIQKHKSTFDILSSLYQEETEDAKPYLKAWKEFIKVWKGFAQDLIERAREAEIKDLPDSPLSNEIGLIGSKLAELAEKETSLWETDLGYYYNPYQTLIWKFKNIGKDDILRPKHVEPKEGMLMLYPHYIKANDAWDKFKNSREAKVWWAHYQICRLAAGVLDTEEEREYFKKNRVVDAFYKFEFDEVARGNINRSPIVLHKQKYDVWIKRLHNYLVPRLQNEINKVSVNAPASEEKEPTKKELKAKVAEIIKSKKFGKMEKTFLRYLAKDFKPKTIIDIESEIGSKAGKQLKSRIVGRIKNTGFELETIRADKWGGHAQYRLKYLTQK